MKAIFDIALDCDIPLPELPETRTFNEIIKVSLGQSGNRKKITDWFHHWMDDDNQICISAARGSDCYILRFPDLVDFEISLSTKSVQYFPANNITPETIRHLLLDQVIPRILGHRGRLILHTSAVIMPNGSSLAFIGESGYGKSTIAASLYQNHATLLTDDCLLLHTENGEITGIPNYYGIRLFDDSAEAIFKNHINCSPVSHDSPKNRLFLPDKTKNAVINAHKMHAFFFLTSPKDKQVDNDVLISPVNGADEMISLINQTFVLDITNKPLIKQQFKAIKALFNSDVKMYKLEFSRRYDVLPLLRSRIEKLV